MRQVNEMSGSGAAGAIDQCTDTDGNAAQDKVGSVSTRAPVQNSVRFASLRSKARPPSQYMYIDEALNRLGATTRPNEWGVGPAWKMHPFKYSGEERDYATYSLKKVEQEISLRRRRLNSALPRADMKAADRVFRDVRDTLKSALERGDVRAAKLMPDGSILDIPQIQHGLWTKKFTPIFYTGHVPDSQDGVSFEYRVLIYRNDFERWIAKIPSETAGAVKNVARALLKEIAVQIGERAKEKGYVPTKDNLFEVVRDALAEEGRDLSNRMFEDVLWKTLGEVAPKSRHAGPRGASGKEIFKRDVEHLKALVRAECAKRKDGSAKRT